MVSKTLFETEHGDGSVTEYLEIPGTSYARRKGDRDGFIYFGSVDPTVRNSVVSITGEYSPERVGKMLRNGSLVGFVPWFESGFHPIGARCDLSDISVEGDRVQMSRGWVDHFMNSNHVGNLIKIVYSYKEHGKR